MFDLDKWKEIWVTISRNKTRSIFTAFGVFWGLFMFIFLVGYGNGFKNAIEDSFSGFSSNSCFFWTERTSEPFKGHRKGRRWRMNSHDLKVIREKARSVEYISPMIFSGGNAVRGSKTGSYTSQGVYPDQFEMQKMNILHGRLINEMDIEKRRKVCVIGKEVYETLFTVNENPVGENIRVNGLYYQVVGVAHPVSENISMGSHPPRTIYIPFTTMQQTTNRGDNFWEVGCTAKPGFPASMVEEEVKRILMENHEISPTDLKAVGSMNIEKEFQTFTNLFTGIGVLIWLVGMGALFSGVIGISNIMLVTVRERMREIGVRRAIGAKPISIISQIISESFVLTAIAGMAGFLFGVLILAIMEQGMSGGGDGDMVIIPMISFNLAITAMIILIVSGVLAGIMPAMKALRVKAIDAIRDE